MIDNYEIQKGLNILIIRFSSLGDIILLDPLIKEVKDGFPGCSIDLATKEEYADIFSHSPEIRRIFTLGGRGLSGLFSLYRRIRAEEYNIVIDAHNVMRSLLLTSLLHSDRTIRIKKHHAKKILLVRRKKNFFGRIPSIRDRYLGLAENLGVNLSGKVHNLTIPDDAIEKTDRLIRSAGFTDTSLIAIAPGARWETKRWPEEYFRELLSRIVRGGHSVILVGDRSETELCRRISGSGNNQLTTAGELTAIETAAILRRCRLLITNDSAPLHISEAAGTPVAALFGPTVKEFGFFPSNEMSKAIEIPLDCRPCSRNGSKPCKFGTKECLRSISVDTVFEASMKILEDRETAEHSRKGSGC